MSRTTFFGNVMFIDDHPGQGHLFGIIKPHHNQVRIYVDGFAVLRQDFLCTLLDQLAGEVLVTDQRCLAACKFG
ncbi:hypothetical protein D3C84_1104900 [compost metagenome]